jgi:hypothetical protein
MKDVGRSISKRPGFQEEVRAVLDGSDSIRSPAGIPFRRPNSRSCESSCQARAMWTSLVLLSNFHHLPAAASGEKAHRHLAFFPPLASLSQRIACRLAELLLQLQQLTQLVNIGRVRVRDVAPDGLRRGLVRFGCLLEDHVDWSPSHNRHDDVLRRRQSRNFLVPRFANVAANALANKVGFIEWLVQTALTDQHRSRLADSGKRPNEDVLPRVLTFDPSFKWPQVQICSSSLDRN